MLEFEVIPVGCGGIAPPMQGGGVALCDKETLNVQVIEPPNLDPGNLSCCH